MKQGNVVKFPKAPTDVDRVCQHRDEPCLVLVLPMGLVDRNENPGQWVGRILSRVLDREGRTPPGGF